MPSSASASTTTRSLARNPRLVYGHHHRLRPRGPRRRPRRVRHRRVLGPRRASPTCSRRPAATRRSSAAAWATTRVGVARSPAAICAALFARERTGKGQLVSTSLLRQGVYTVGFDLNMVLGWGLTTGVGTRDADGQPGDQQLHRRRRPAVLDRRPRRRPPLAAARAAPSAIRSGSTTPASPPRRAARANAARADRAARRELRHEDARRVGRDLRHRARLLLGAGQHAGRRRRRPAAARTPAASSRCPTSYGTTHDDRHRRPTSTARRGRHAGSPRSSASTPPRCSRELGKSTTDIAALELVRPTAELAED